MLTTVCFEDLWVNEVSVSFLQQLDLKMKNKTCVQLYWFVINELKVPILVYFPNANVNAYNDARQLLAGKTHGKSTWRQAWRRA